MFWNHRRVRDEQGKVRVCEVYYNDDGSLMGYCSSNRLDLMVRPGWLWKAWRKPVLRHETFVSDFDD